MTRVFLRLILFSLALHVALLMMGRFIGQSLPPAPLIVSTDYIPPGLTQLQVTETRTGVTSKRPLAHGRIEWSPDTCKVALLLQEVTGSPVTLVDISVHTVQSYTFKGLSPFGRFVQWSSDSRFLAEMPNAAGAFIAIIDSQHADIRYFAVDSDHPQRWIAPWAWSPDNKYVGYAASSSYVLDVTSGESHLISPVYSQAWQWSADGQYVVTSEAAEPDGPIIVHVPAARRISLPYPVYGYVADYGAAVWSPTGHRLAFQGFAADGRDHGYVFDVDTGMLTTLSSAAPIQRPPLWSPDGKWLIYFSRSSMLSVDLLAHIVNSETGALFHEEIVQSYNPPVWSPDSRYLLMPFSRDENFMRVLDMNTGQRIEWEPEHAAYITATRWFPDSRTFSFISYQQSDLAIIQAAQIQDDRIELTARYTVPSTMPLTCFPKETP